jgi:hypothetical protein
MQGHMRQFIKILIHIGLRQDGQDELVRTQGQ